MHKSLLIDSDVLIDHLRKETDTLAFLSGEIERGSLLFMSVVSRTEIIPGYHPQDDRGGPFRLRSTVRSVVGIPQLSSLHCKVSFLLPELFRESRITAW